MGAIACSATTFTSLRTCPIWLPASGPFSIFDPTGLAVKVAENPSVQVLREKFADEHAVGVICWMEVDSKVENKQKIAVLAMGAGG